MTTLNDLRKHIKNCKKKNRRYNFLGFVENKNLSPEVERLFTFYKMGCACGYDWVNGNDKLEEFIKQI